MKGCYLEVWSQTAADDDGYKSSLSLDRQWLGFFRHMIHTLVVRTRRDLDAIWRDTPQGRDLVVCMELLGVREKLSDDSWKKI